MAGPERGGQAPAAGREPVAEGQDVRFRNREILIETLRHRDDSPA